MPLVVCAAVACKDSHCAVRLAARLSLRSGSKRARRDSQREIMRGTKAGLSAELAEEALWAYRSLRACTADCVGRDLETGGATEELVERSIRPFPVAGFR